MVAEKKLAQNSILRINPIFLVFGREIRIRSGFNYLKLIYQKQGVVVLHWGCPISRFSQV